MAVLTQDDLNEVVINAVWQLLRAVHKASPAEDKDQILAGARRWINGVAGDMETAEFFDRLVEH
jgi:hypothetical protein